MVSLQPPPEPLELATVLPPLDAELLEAPPALDPELVLEVLPAPPAPPAPVTELLTLDAVLLEPAPAPPELEAEPPTLEAVPLEAPPTPPAPDAELLTLDAALLEATFPLVCVASITTSDPHAPVPSMTTPPMLAARLATQACLRHGILIGPALSTRHSFGRAEHGTKLELPGPGIFDSEEPVPPLLIFSRARLPR